KTEKLGAIAAMSAPTIDTVSAPDTSWRVVNQRTKYDDSGTRIANTSKYPVVNHCPILAETEKSSMILVKVMFNAVSPNKPIKVPIIKITAMKFGWLTFKCESMLITSYSYIF